MLWFALKFIVYAIKVRFFGETGPEPLYLRDIDDLTADWIFDEGAYMGEDVWKCPRCHSIAFMGAEHAVAYYTKGVPWPKPPKCEKCGWFKPGLLDLLAREGR